MPLAALACHVGPLLFLIYINDLEIGIKSKIKFFAEDTMIYSVAINALRTAKHELSLHLKGTRTNELYEEIGW